MTVTGVSGVGRTLTFTAVLLLALTHVIKAQQTRDQPNKKDTSTKNASWQDDKFEVHAEFPYISQSGWLVLEYTVTNRSGRDLVFYREGQGTFTGIESGDQEIKLFKRLKAHGAYDEVDKDNRSVELARTSLPADVPIRMRVGFALPEKETRVTSAIDHVLPNVDAVIILVPSRRIRIVLPVRR